MREIVYRGQLCYAKEGEDDDLVGILNPETHRIDILAEKFDNDLRVNGRFVNVSYFVSDKPETLEEIQKDFILHLTGAAESKFGSHYSELTGYLWTDEELKVGGHDLIGELKSKMGKYLYLTVQFNRNAKSIGA